MGDYTSVFRPDLKVEQNHSAPDIPGITLQLFSLVKEYLGFLESEYNPCRGRGGQMHKQRCPQCELRRVINEAETELNRWTLD